MKSHTCCFSVIILVYSRLTVFVHILELDKPNMHLRHAQFPKKSVTSVYNFYIAILGT